jgi:hypothetical protein
VTRLLLVELMADEPERQIRTTAYPFLSGLARLLGWQASWCALGVRYAPTLRYALPPADLRLLLAQTAGFRPKIVVYNERLPEAQLKALAAAGPGARLAFWDAGDSLADFADAVRRLIPEAAGRRLGSPGFLERIRPDHRRRILNDAPWTAQRFIRVISGTRCAYRAPLSANPRYRGLPLGRTLSGCAFCGTPSADAEGPALPARGPVAFAARQVLAACRQRSPSEEELRFDLVGCAPWLRLEEFLGRLLRGGAARAELDFTPRIDELLARKAVITRCLPRLADRGLAIRINGMGVENFSPAENLRLNKGISPAQVHEAADFLLKTQARWPGRFRLPRGGLGMILFTPWTTMKDLIVNLDHIERCPLLDRPFVLSRRLQLFPGRPISLLVEKDGLAAKGWDDFFYNSGCIVSADQSEIPWRFRNPEVGVLWRLAWRLSSDRERVPADDPEKRAVDRFLAAGPTREGPPDPIPLFRRAVAEMRRHPRTRSVQGLLRLMNRKPRVPDAR